MTSIPAYPDQVNRTILALWRVEQPRLMTGLARLLRDVPLAEELTQEAFVVALERWPEEGVPERPGAWLMTTAKRRALDHIRRVPMLAQKHGLLAAALEAEQQTMPDWDTALDDDIGDEMLRLIFTACHPLLVPEARAALALRMICGLTTREIARAFLQSETTISQRIVRAKKALSNGGLDYETASREALSARTPSVLEVIYLIFNEGYAAAFGDDWIRPQLCDEARRLGRILVAAMPAEPEAHGLLALMELNASRFAARTDAEGNLILLQDQDRGLWDYAQIRRGLQVLAQAYCLGGEAGFYILQAAIAACHAQASAYDQTDWARIARLYAQLAAVTGSPVVELNRAVAVSMVEGPAAGLAIIEAIAGAPSLKAYHLLLSARGDLLFKLERFQEAGQAFSVAAQMAGNQREREFLTRRAAEAVAATIQSGHPASSSVLAF